MAAKKRTSEELWRFQASDRIVRTSVSRQSDWVILADQSRRAVVLDEKGEQQWQTQLEFPIHDVAANEKGTLFACLLQDGSIRSFGRIGAERWKAQFDRDVTCFSIGLSASWIAVGLRNQQCVLYSPNMQMDRKVSVDHRVASIALVESAGNDLIVASEVGDISCLNPDGTVLWSHRIRSHTGRVTVSGDAQYIVIPGYEEGVHTFERSGEGAGAYDLGQPVILTDVSQDGQIMVACTEQNRIYCIDRDANILWFKDFDETVCHLSLNAAADLLVVAFESREVAGIALRTPGAKARPSSLQIGDTTFSALEERAAKEETTHIEEEGEPEPAEAEQGEDRTPVADIEPEPVPQKEATPLQEAAPSGREAPSQVISSQMDDSETRDEEEGYQELQDDEVVIVEDGDFVETPEPESREMLAAQEAAAEEQVAEEKAGPASRRLMWRQDIGELVKPDHGRGLFVSREGSFVALITAGGPLLVYDREGQRRGEVEVEPGAELVPHRNEKFAVAWTEDVLLKLDIGTGKAQQFEFGRIHPQDIAVTRDLKLIAFIHDDNRISALSSSGKILWRKRNPKELRSVHVSPRAEFIIVEDEDNRFLFYNSEGQLVRKHRFETTKAFRHVVAERTYTAFANSHGRLVVLDSSGKQIWTKRVCRRLVDMHSLGDHLGVLDRSGVTLVLDLYGDLSRHFGKVGGLRYLTKPRGEAPILYNAEGEVLTAFKPPKSRVAWRYHCPSEIKALAADLAGEMVVCAMEGSICALDGTAR